MRRRSIAACALACAVAALAHATAAAALAHASAAAALAHAQDARPHAARPKNLRVEYLKNPLAIDDPHPRFSWEVDDPRRGAVQSAYEVRVVESKLAPSQDGPAIWDSGKVSSSATNQIEYAGSPLAAKRTYSWSVRTYDGAGEASPWSDPASFGMGPLSPSDWKAQWIGDATPVEPPTPARNGYHSQFAPKSDDYKWVQIDLGSSDIPFDGVKLYPARPFDWKPDTPGFLFPVRFKLWVSADPEFTSGFQLIDDESRFDVPNPLTGVYEFHLKNTRMKIRYVRVGVFKMGTIEGKGSAFALAEMQVVDGQNVVSQGKKATASDSIESGDWSLANLTDGDLVSHGRSDDRALPSPLLHKGFVLAGKPKSAIAYASALGLYQLSINGKRIGDAALAPGWTDYKTRVEYQAYDVTDALRAGDNSIDAMLGDGWCAGRIGLASVIGGVPRRGIYARRPRFLAQVEIELESGEKTTIATDSTWSSTADGPIRSADLLDGERYDARQETGVKPPKWAPVEVASELHPALEPDRCEPIRVVQHMAPVKLTNPVKGVHVFDMGQNMVGWCRLKVRGEPGTVVTLRHAEVLTDAGLLYFANLRDAAQTDTYTLRGGEQVFEPHFTYHGFRYVEVTGLEDPPQIGDLAAEVVGTGAREIGTFTSSNPTLNRLWQNIRWTLRGNLMSVPTDCPQRDERLGWMGDINAFAQTAMFEMDLAAFFTKWLADVRDAQADDGRFPDFAPHPYGKNERFTGTPGWGDAGVNVPWLAYVNYGDKRLLEKSYPSVVRWIEHIQKANPDLVWAKDRGNDYGDWLNGDALDNLNWSKKGGAVPNEVLATAMFAHSTEIASKMAAALGRADDARRFKDLFEKIKVAFDAAFVTQDGVVKGNTQGGYALALAFDLLPLKLQPRAMAHLSVDITEKHDGHLTTGFQTTHLALDELARRGLAYVEVASRLARDKSFPSWGYMIDQGATTIWERRDGFVKGRGFQDPGMNSFNHYAFGSVGEYMIRWIAGIQPDEDAPGWSHFTVRPRGGIQIQHARAEIATIRGAIASGWKLAGEKIHLDVTIPANTSASVYLPTQEFESITVDGRPVADAQPNVLLVDMKDGEALLDVRAGTYAFECKRPPQ